MDKEDERQSHFAGYARLLWDKLLAVQHGYIDIHEEPDHHPELHAEYRKAIAQAAYDLLYSYIEHVYVSKGLPPMHGEIPQYIKMCPDLTAWPESQAGKQIEAQERCYKDDCLTSEMFADCDDCGRWGCQDHITLTSKFVDSSDPDAPPFMYLCWDCLDKRKASQKVYP